MASLLENLKIALEETTQRLKLLEERGPDAVKLIYPDVSLDARQIYHSLIESLPQEIDRLEFRIRNLQQK